MLNLVREEDKLILNNSCYKTLTEDFDAKRLDVHKLADDKFTLHRLAFRVSMV